VNHKKKLTRLDITKGKFMNEALRLCTTKGAYCIVEILVMMERQVPIVPHMVADTRGLIEAIAHPMKNIAATSF
jgi:hypothetical protein